MMISILTITGIVLMSGVSKAEYLYVNWVAIENEPNFTVSNSGTTGPDHNSWRNFPGDLNVNDGDTIPNPNTFPFQTYGVLYDSGNIDTFNIYLKGYNEYIYDEIDVFVSFDDLKPTSTSGNYYRLSSSSQANVYSPNYRFEMTFDLVNREYFGVENLQWNGSDWVGNSFNGNIVYDDTNFDPLELFKNKDNFWIGYGCHFEHWKTGVTVMGDGYVNTVIPEPATMFLFGSGLIGLAGFGRRKFFKKS